MTPMHKLIIKWIRGIGFPRLSTDTTDIKTDLTSKQPQANVSAENFQSDKERKI